MPKRVDDLAQALVREVDRQRHAGRLLHDDIGPLLSAAGLRLQLLRMDFPDASPRVSEVLEALDEAMERVRELSQALNPSPVFRAGFKGALAGLVESQAEEFKGKIKLTYTSSVQLPPDAGVVLYEAASAAMAGAVENPRTTRIDVSVSGSKSVKVVVKSNGQPARVSGALAMAMLMARHSGLTVETSTGKGTIVCITHALRRPSRR
jgi:signal transduction histidine kinase